MPLAVAVVALLSSQPSRVLTDVLSWNRRAAGGYALIGAIGLFDLF